jgi:hypothetical protein
MANRTKQYALILEFGLSVWRRVLLKWGWLIFLLVLWMSAILPHLVEAQTPQQSAQTPQQPVPPPQPNSAQPAPTGGEKQTDNTAAIITAIAAVIASLAGGVGALKALKNSRDTLANVKQEQEKFKEQFQNELLKNSTLFEQVMRLVLTKRSESEDIWVLFFERLVSNKDFENEFDKYEERLSKSEEELLRLSESVFMLSPLLEHKRVRKRLEERAQKLLEPQASHKNLKGDN